MSGSRRDRLDDETAERLLNGEPADSGSRHAIHLAEPAAPGPFSQEPPTRPRSERPSDQPPKRPSDQPPGRSSEGPVGGSRGTAFPPGAAGGVVERYQALAELLRAAATPAVDPEREEAALAAFRAARPVLTGDASDADPRETAPALNSSRRVRGGVRAVDGHRRSRSTRVVIGTLAAATLLATGVAAAAAGVIPTPFTGDVHGPAPHVTGRHGHPASPSRNPPRPRPAGSMSAPPTGPDTPGPGVHRLALGGPFAPRPSGTARFDAPSGHPRAATGAERPCPGLPPAYPATPDATPTGVPGTSASCRGPAASAGPSGLLPPVGAPFAPGGVPPSPDACPAAAPPSPTPSPASLPPLAPVPAAEPPPPPAPAPPRPPALPRPLPSAPRTR